MARGTLPTLGLAFLTERGRVLGHERVAQQRLILSGSLSESEPCKADVEMDVAIEVVDKDAIGSHCDWSRGGTRRRLSHMTVSGKALGGVKHPKRGR